MTNLNPTNPPKDFAAAIVDRIEAENITMHSRLWFVLRDVAFWSLWFLSALIGAFALSATLFVLQSSSWRLYLVTHNSFLDYATDVMPYVWLITFVLMCTVAYVNLRHTPKGYRYSTFLLIVLNMSVTVFLAILLTAAGLGKFVDEQVGKHVPLYSSITRKQEMEWYKPDEGLLIGEVTYVDQPTHTFVLHSPEKTEIDVDGRLLSNEEWQLLSVSAVHVRVIGIPHEVEPFVACIVLPVVPPGIVPMPLGYPERSLSEPRSTECKGVRPYDRFDQIKHW